MGLTLVGDIATLQTQFETIKEEVDKQFDKTILNLEETSWAIIRKKRDFLLRTTDWTNDSWLYCRSVSMGIL
jgi:hypothetical protein